MSPARDRWYRSSSWTPADEEAFRARLRRSRSAADRAQYLRIQALYLEQAGLVAPAVTLLEEALADDPDGFEATQIHHQLASCREKQGRLADALAQARLAIAAEAREPSHLTGAWLTFGRLVVENAMHERYDEVLAVIAARRALPGGVGLSPFPAEEYALSAILAVISANSGDVEEARRLARAALAAARQTRSGFPRHPHVGLVRDTDTRLHALVVALARDA